MLKRNHTHLLRSAQRTLLVPKRAVFEADLVHDVLSNDIARSIQGDTALLDELGRVFPSMRLSAQAVKLQLARRGGAFPMHHDAAGWPDSRMLSAILYLNADWKAGDGGELRLYPFPFDSLDVQPLDDRLVIFGSESMLHRVLALHAHRRQAGGVWQCMAASRLPARPPCGARHRTSAYPARHAVGAVHIRETRPVRADSQVLCHLVVPCRPAAPR